MHFLRFILTAINAGVILAIPLPSNLGETEVLNQSELKPEVNLSLLSYHTGPYEVETPCYYNINDKDQSIGLDISQKLDFLLNNNENGLLNDFYLSRIRRKIEKDTNRQLITSLDELKGTCNLKPNEIKKLKFKGNIFIVTVGYKFNLNSEKESGKFTIAFPEKNFNFDCLEGNYHCNLNSVPFSTTFT